MIKLSGDSTKAAEIEQDIRCSAKKRVERELPFASPELYKELEEETQMF